MEKVAFKTTGPLQETTRHNIRNEVDESGEDVYFLRKRPLSLSELRSSPTRGDNTFLLIGDKKMQEDRLKILEEKYEQVQNSLSSLQREMKIYNFRLYEPLYGNRVQATVSLMRSVLYKLDEFVEANIVVEGQHLKGAERAAFANKFESKRKYLQLVDQKDPTVTKIVKAAESNLLATYAQRGIQVTKSINVQGSMKAFKKIKRKRDLITHIFDYDYKDASVEERKDSFTIQAKILEDIKEAMQNGWLPKSVDSRDQSLLHLEVQRKILELEEETRCTLNELIDMPYRAENENQKRRKIED